ncbi:MAG: hypothetical protein DRP70_13710 [Spirochaetes bacterium]|nr:MAG: hypothetical protein DRP70_13710 [Spirochaetota bacterium]
MKRFHPHAPAFLITLTVILALAAQPLTASTPTWVSTYGTDTPYPRDKYLTGYASVSKDEPSSREQARDFALAVLSGKIRTRVQSELVQIASESEGNFSSSVSQITRNSVNVTISGADFILHEDRRSSYALAYIPLETLAKNFTDEASDYWGDIRESRQKAGNLLDSGKSGQSLEILYNAASKFPNLYDRWVLVRTLSAPEMETGFFSSLQGVDNLADLRSAESEIQSLIDNLTNRDAENITEAAGKIAIMLKIQNVPGGRIQVPSMLYESTSFSSEFGRYAAERLESRLVENLEPGREMMVFRSQYWEEENKIRIIVLASDISGEKKGRAEVLLPSSAAGSRSLKPQGFDAAMVALQEFADGAVSDGGLNIDIWTNKGRDEDSLVFTDGEILQLYFRVNQPAHLQITYRLANNELVLLEDSFYIGSDRVNRTIPLPYEFEVQPPFGVENLIVTAYSVEPPPVSTVPRYIDGELYQIFESLKDVVANTRGLGRRQDSSAKEMRVGEAMLTITTLSE